MALATTPLDYFTALGKGNTLLQSLSHSSDPQTPGTPTRTLTQSPYPTPSSLYIYGYEFVPSPCPSNHLSSLAPCLSSLGLSTTLSTAGGQNRAIRHHHSRQWVDQFGMTCAPTFAHYAQLCNPAQGLLVAETNLGVRQAALEHETPNVNFFTGSGLPPLRRWSDVAFLQYVEAAREVGGEVAMGRDVPELVKGLRYVLRFRVQEPTTRTVVDWVLQQSGSKLVPWPGVTFGMDTGEGKAVLGAINGSGVAYMLAQRREALGRKTVEKVTVFGTEDTAVQPCPSLLFWIKDL